MSVFLQILLGWLYGHLAEYVIHRWILHNRRLKRAFVHHFAQHHARARRGVMIDHTSLAKVSIGEFEIRALVFAVVLHFPIIFFFPYFYCAIIYSALAYYFVHRRSHRDNDWGRNNIPWHYDHHMGRDSNKNWGVRLPIFDYLFGTREIYKDTLPEKARFLEYKKRGKYVIRSRRAKRYKYKKRD